MHSPNTAVSQAGTPEFLMTETELRARHTTKWASFGPDILPAFVAEMDFRIAPPIQAAIERIVSAQDYGYYRAPGDKDTPHPLALAFAQRMRARHGWNPDAALARPVTDLVQGLYAAVTAFSDPGQGVVIQTPIYPQSAAPSPTPSVAW